MSSEILENPYILNSMEIVVGPPMEEGPIIVGVQEIIVHPKYRPRKNKNDIALLRLNQTLTFSATVNNVTLPRSSCDRNKPLPDGTHANVTIWAFPGKITSYFPLLAH